MATKKKTTRKTKQTQANLTDYDENFGIYIPNYLIVVMSPGRPKKTLLADTFEEVQQKVSDALLKDKYAVFLVYGHDAVYTEAFNNMPRPSETKQEERELKA